MPDISWVESVKTQFKDKIISVRESVPNEFEFTVNAADAHDFLSGLKSLEGGAFDHLADLTAYDEHPKAQRFYMVYELISMSRKQRCAVIAPVVDGDKPSIATVSDLWSGANWLEREVFDLMGINFEAHPDPRRILLPPSFVGHPLRKDFVVDYRQQFAEPSDDNQTFDPFGNNIVNVPVKEP